MSNVQFINGQWQQQLSSVPPNTNFSVMPLRQAWQTHKNLIAQHIDEPIPGNDGPEDGGIVIHFNKNTRCEQPLHLMFQQPHQRHHQ